MHSVAGPAHRFVIGAFDAFPANVAILDARGVILAVNQGWIAFAEENGGTPDLGLNYLGVCRGAVGEGGADAIVMAQGIEQVLRGEVPFFEHEYPCHSPTEERYFMARVAPFTQDGEAFAVVVHHNITARKHAELEVKRLNASLEERVGERTRQLEVAQLLLEEQNRELQTRNAELAQFALVASHDLQEPLRILGLYADVLQHRLQGRIDPKTDEHLGVIQAQVARARQLVQDVLALTEIKPAQPGEGEVQNLGALWEEVTGGLHWPPGATFTRTALPPVLGDAVLLRQLLENLLGNAIKFRSERPLQVHLTGARKGQEVHFSLRDNGIGVPPEKREFVFSTFSRLHPRRSFEGNGIGLAVCQRIVERYQGRIWLTEAEGGGLEVHFTLPAASGSD